MKYYIEIDGVEYANCSMIDVTASYRAEGVQKSIKGDLLVDRIGQRKVKLVAKLNALFGDDVQTLLAAYDKIAVTVKYGVLEDADNAEEKTMYINAFKVPSPVPVVVGDEDKLFYSTITVTFDEV